MPKLDLDEEIEKIDNIEDKLSIAEDYIKSRSTGENDWVLFHEKTNKDDEQLDSYIEKSKINIVLFSNVLWDAQIHFEEAIFEETLDWIKKTIEFTSEDKTILFSEFTQVN